MVYSQCHEPDGVGGASGGREPAPGTRHQAPPLNHVPNRPSSRLVPPPTPRSAPSHLGPPRPEGLLSTSGRRPAVLSTSAFAHVVRFALSPRFREWGRVRARPTGPGVVAGVSPDSRGRAGCGEKGRRGEQEGLGRSRSAWGSGTSEVIRGGWSGRGSQEG